MVASDAEVLDLLRVDGPMGVSDLADAIAVTATAVRQRLMRLMGQGLIGRDAILRSHGHLFAYKKEGYFVRQRWLRAPLDYTLLRPSIGKKRWLQQSLLLAVILLLSNPLLRVVVQRLPNSWLAWLSRWGRTTATKQNRE